MSSFFESLSSEIIGNDGLTLIVEKSRKGIKKIKLNRKKEVSGGSEYNCIDNF